MDPADSSADEVLSRVAAGSDLTLRYADHPDGLIDVFFPPALGRPPIPAALVVILHGGFWRQEFDRTHLRPLAASLVRDGLVVATPEYRRGGGGWPATGQDVATALAATPELIERAAPGRIDPQRPLVLAGHSAGAQLALWSGLGAGPTKIARIVALAPVADLVYAARTCMGDNAVQDFLGGAASDVPAAYAEADPLRLLPGRVPVTIVQGTGDRQVPVAANRQLAARHPDIEYVELPGVDHFALIDPLSDAFQTSVRPRLCD
ncbi:MAG: alpha/beta hydrolase family protein [Nocardioidaceae bacterium]